ncbi:MAG TPA: methyltransferase domain-containing protein, partial [Acidimicrobiales bacterium]|nr:methyltransferase domain-containing protein [Acidimicrobiales bacterium]
QTLDALLALVRPEDTLLDVGTGTGRFAVPLAHVVRHVTALDHAPAMLAVLERKLVAERLSNVTIVETAWEAAEVPPHDVVLAAWSLYRQLDLRSTVEKLVAATRRTLVIIAPDMADPPHRPLVQSIWDRDGEPDVPTYLYILGALRQLGVRADLRVVHETRLVVGRCPTELAHQLAPIDGTEADIQRLASGLLPLLQQYGDDWQYAYTFPAAIMTWRPAG